MSCLMSLCFSLPFAFFLFFSSVGYRNTLRGDLIRGLGGGGTLQARGWKLASSRSLRLFEVQSVSDSDAENRQWDREQYRYAHLDYMLHT
jgi:hypothetical protein